MAQTLQLKSPVSQSNLNPAIGEAKAMFKELSDDLTAEGTTFNDRRVDVMTLDNGLFTRQNYELQPDFQWSVKNEFQATIQQLDFNNQSESARQINSWVNSATRGLIPRFFRNPSELSRETRLAIFNVFTFRDNWLHPFSPGSTKNEEFIVGKDKRIIVPMMSKNEMLPYVDMPDKGFAIIRKPLKNYRFSFVVALPTEKGNMEGVEKLLTGQYCLQSTFKAQKDTAVSLKLPKFKLEKALDLIPTMESMGLTDIFHRGMADLSGITKSERLYVSLLRQSTVLKVDEAGVEAAAATGAVATPTSYQQPETKFHVTHSFVCMIYDEQLHVPLVAARVMQPAS
ncbi:uncharacterized protein DEA37_0008056 [Paragonimus westermani]|uniref:Serpin domain-containing protein n=1 Tax=Paragonimus westermani TaxID=34504 RepID=A0A5J4NCW1_9TREM|nr:uncharacterized protein DEA37_0008056 [Paragonimus westermani]